jgi:hypothetical protein
VRSAARAVAIAASLAACRFGGPSGSPDTYVAFPDDAASPSEGGTDDGEPGALDVSPGDVALVGDETSVDALAADALAADVSTEVEAATEGGSGGDSDAGSDAGSEAGGDAGCLIVANDAACDSSCQPCP